MSIKIERLNDEFQKEISYILMTEVKDQNVKFVTITDVDITSDLSYAKVYFTVLKDEYLDVTLKALNKASSFIRGKLSQKINIRHTPEIKFIFDESVKYGEKIEKIIEEINKED